MVETRRLRDWARRVKRDLVAVAGATRDPRTPWAARILALAVVAYALSPIDLIPDFIPVLGLLDDVILVPAGLVIVMRLIPPDVMEEHRRRAEGRGRLAPSHAAAAFIGAMWVAALALVGWWVSRAYSARL